MSSKHKYPNINVSCYDGETQISCDCIRDPMKCAHLLTHTIPPEADDTCTFYASGNCHKPAAQLAAMKHARAELDSQIKAMEDFLKDS